MTRLNRFAAGCAAVILLAGNVAAQDIPAQDFTLDPSHTSVTFKINHLGLSNFTASFDEVSGTLSLDPANPAEASLNAEIAVASLDLPAPPEGFLDAMLAPPWFDAVTHPTMTYVSESVTLAGAQTARVEGTLTINGQAQPVPLDVTFNSGYPAGLFEPHARIGFSAETEINRSAFGMTFGVPEEGTDVGIGDTVRIRIEAELTGTGGD